MGREEACIRFATAPTRRLPGIGPKTAERLAELGYAHGRPAPGGRRGPARRPLRRPHGPLPEGARDLPRRLAGRDRGRRGQVRLHRADVRRGHRLRTRSSRRSCARSSTELCEGLQRKSRQGRTVAIKVRLADWTTVTRARTLPGRDQRHRAGHRDGAGAAARLRARRSRCACSASGSRRSTTSSPTSRRRRSRRWASWRCRCRAAAAGTGQYSARGELAARVARQRIAPGRARRARRRRPCAARPCARRPRRPRSRRSARPGPPRSRPRRAGRTRPRAPGRRTGGCGSPGPRRRTSRARWTAAPARPRGRRRRPASAPAGSPRRRGRARARARGAGWSPRPRRPARRPRRGRSGRGSARPGRAAAAPMNSSTTLPSLNALTAGIDWIPKACDKPRVGVRVDLDEIDLAVALGRRPARSRARASGMGRTTRPRSRRPRAARRSAG